MRAVIQRVKSARLEVDGALVSEIGQGLVVFFGVKEGDDLSAADYIVRKIANMRLFEDGAGKMNLALSDVRGEVLFVSQFTLFAQCRHGNRPGFSLAEKPETANRIYEYAAQKLAELVPVKKGVFGADMKILQQNDGPVTIILDSEE
ncbi:MAG: D-aminoacyl-tRNA deacylase [Candidatus Neoclostridium sp.]